MVRSLRSISWATEGALSSNGVKNYSIGFVCDLPGVTPGTTSTAMKRPIDIKHVVELIDANPVGFKLPADTR